VKEKRGKTKDKVQIEVKIVQYVQQREKNKVINGV
jgi:hypothetical protein